ncbi:cation:proton antiporter domain-containing protein [Microbacterium sp. XT11]|uniref:cation:proton antiporter domain-containing protein n=1 Tax=Microbacterium sp. XT11 TaxID=367477 RepID=UPI000742E611|nr:cation:proton antiporter [Microbacterium sp. XT11]ALX67344.1 hypothetical protein AB663_003245 [Microbacterium sp. XT11]
MQGLEVTVLLGLTILAGTLLAPRVRLALPLVLVIFGLILGFVPALREVQLPPETVLLLFLPVMLFWESLTTSLRSIRRDFRYILPMSTLLVVASAFAVAGVGVLLGMPWEIALILGAAAAPPDATAVAALGRLLPRRSFMKLKAESLTNDGTALVLYAIAVSLAVGGQVTPLSITGTLLVSFVLIGLEVQFVVHQISVAAIGRLVLVTITVWAALVVVRYLFQWLSVPFQRYPGPRPPRGMRARARVVSTVAGMRGAVSLAIALSVPVEVGASGREEIVFVTAGVILLSLLVQGPLLPAVVRWARLPADTAEVEELELAERTISGAALAALDDLAVEHGIGQEVLDRVRSEGYQMLELANARALAREQAAVDAEADALDAILGEPDPYDTASAEAGETDAGTDGALQIIATSTAVDLAQRSPLIRHEEHTRLKLALLDRKREVLLGLRRSGAVDDMVVRRIVARLDLEQVRLQGIEEFD